MSNEAKVKVYKETMDCLLQKAGMNKKEFSELLGYSRAWCGIAFKRGYYDLPITKKKLWSHVLKCREEDLTAIPVSQEGKVDRVESVMPSIQVLLDAIQNLANIVHGEIIEVQELHKDIAKMLHTDIRSVVDTMDKYWRPDPPKYQVKDIEQS